MALPAALLPVPCGEDTAVLMEPPLPKLFSCICVTGRCELQPSRGWHRWGGGKMRLCHGQCPTVPQGMGCMRATL